MNTVQERRRDRLVTVSPLTGGELGDYPIMGAAEVRALVAVAREAQAEWSSLSLDERAKSMARLRRLIADRADEIAETIRGETGKVKGEALSEALIACDLVNFLAEKAPRALLARQAAPGAFTLTHLHQR